MFSSWFRRVGRFGSAFRSSRLVGRSAGFRIFIVLRFFESFWFMVFCSALRVVVIF